MAKKFRRIRLYAVMTDAPNFRTRYGIVSAFSTQGQARDEMNDLRSEGEHWWVQPCITVIPQRKRAR